MRIGSPSLLGLLLIAGLVLGACTPGTMVPSNSAPVPAALDNQSLMVFAAASLTDAFSEMGRAFEAMHPGLRVVFNFAGSQNLRAQIEQGAAADVFASANSTEMNTLVSDKLIQEGSARDFLTNQLVVVLPSDNPAGITSLQDLAKPGLKLDLAAEEVPVGKYARQMLGNLNATLGPDYKDRVLANVVSNETDVRQVVAKVQLGEADAGIVYLSDAVAAPALQKIDIPDGANVVATYPIAPLARNARPDLATSFIDYVLSEDGQAILKKWGFGPVAP